MNNFKIKNINLPSSPGCYLMKNQAGEIIYIGKAKNLAKRVRSYFQKNHQVWKIGELVEKIADIEFMVTRNEVEALILEARLIKQHQPKYNSLLKENQPYMYIKITDEEFPRLVSARKIEGGGKYFGPFTSGKGRKYLLLTTARLFGLRTGKLISKSSRELYHLLSEIKERELKNISPADYQKNVKLAELYLRGRRGEIVKDLEERMKKASEERNYELAKFYRDQIHSIEMTTEKQLISLPKNYDQDVINYVAAGGEALFSVFNVSRGLITSRHDFLIKITEPDKILRDFISQYYLTRPVPKEIIVPELISEENLINKYLEELKGQKVIINFPRIGDKKKLLDLVKENILIKLAGSPEKDLAARLGLVRPPAEIDGFDISNIAGQLAVGSCVRFSRGAPNKNLYRRFKIKTVLGPDDYAMLKEVISRRYRRGRADEWDLPDLILVDGGKGQLNIALKVIADLKLNLPVISLAKRAEEVFIANQKAPIVFDRSSATLKLLQRIRDEAHRFAIGYHKLLRGKRR